MTVCIAGKNEIAIKTAKLLEKEYPQFNLVACINKTDDGVDYWQPSFKKYCNNNKIKIMPLNEVYSIKDLLFLSLEYDRILKPKLFSSHQLINLHFSKLPAYKGMYTSVLPLINGETESGVTLHEIDRGIDTGNIIDQFIFPIDTNITARGLYTKYMFHGLRLIKKNISSLVDKKYMSYSQPVEGSTYFAKDSIDFNNIQFNLNATAFQIHNQIRAFIFRDYQLPIIAGNKIYKSELILEIKEGKPGTIYREDDFVVELNTIDFKLRLYKDKLEDLFSMAQVGDIVNLKRIKDAGFPISTRSKEGWDIFIVGCYYNQQKFIQYCLGIGWDVNTKNYKGTTALMYAMTAAIEGRGQDTFKFLLDIADITLKDYMGRDVYFYAKQNENAELLGILESKLNK